MRHSHNPYHPERGAIGIIFLLTLVFVLIPITGLAIDAARLYVVKAKLVNAVDAAALASARSLSLGMTVSDQTASAVSTAQNYFSANFPVNFWGSTASVTTAVDQTSYKIRTVTVQGAATVPLIFMQAIGVSSTLVAATGQASRRDINVILVLDRSGSMAASHSCGPMKAAAQGWADGLSNGRDTVGLITFMQSASLDYAPTVNFKTQTPTLDAVIGEIACTSSTATAAALNLAYQQIKTINQPGALNIIVLFTDGMPNGVEATYPRTATSTCAAGAVLFGSISEGSPTSGILDPTAVPPSSNPRGTIPATGCAFKTLGSNAVDQDVQYIPDQDAFGNSTFGYLAAPTYTSGPGTGHIRVDQSSALVDASMNAADNQAKTIRSDSVYQTIIYTLGYGSLVNKTFCMRVANDPSSPIYDATLPAGKFVYADNSSQLAAAFDSILSEILRLSE